jgi:hypothetical protein
MEGAPVERPATIRLGSTRLIESRLAQLGGEREPNLGDMRAGSLGATALGAMFFVALLAGAPLAIGDAAWKGLGPVALLKGTALCMLPLAGAATWPSGAWRPVRSEARELPGLRWRGFGKSVVDRHTPPPRPKAHSAALGAAPQSRAIVEWEVAGPAAHILRARTAVKEIVSVHQAGSEQWARKASISPSSRWPAPTNDPRSSVTVSVQYSAHAEPPL